MDDEAVFLCGRVCEMKHPCFERVPAYTMSRLHTKIGPLVSRKQAVNLNRAKTTSATYRHSNLCSEYSGEVRMYAGCALGVESRSRDKFMKRAHVSLDSGFSFSCLAGLPHSPAGSKAISVREQADQNLRQSVFEIPVGGMDRETWQKMRGDVIYFARHGSPEQAEKLLTRLVSEAENQSDMYVNATLYNACLHSWAKQGNPQRAQDLLRTMESRYLSDPKLHIAPVTISYNAVLNAWAASSEEMGQGDQSVAVTHEQRVEDLIAEMEQLAETNPNGPFVPDTQSYNLVMLCYANRGRQYGSPQKAEDCLLKLAKMAATSTSSVEPDTVSFNTVLKAWCASEEAGAPQRAHQILQLMIRLFREGHVNCRPDRVSFATVANAYGKQRSQSAAANAHKVLQQAQELNLPDVDLTQCFNCVLQAWAWSGAANAGDRAEELLLQPHELVCPDVISYTACLEAHANSSGPERAQEFLRQMLLSYKTGDTTVFPNTVTFNNMIHAWVKSNHEDKSQKADSLLILMDRLAEETPDSDCSPDASSFNMCIDSWINNHSADVDGSTHALALLDRAEQAGVPLGNFSYNCVIKGLSESSHRGAASKAVEVLQRMERKSQRGDSAVQPDVITYNVVLKALANARDIRAAKKALEIVNRMENEFQRSRNKIIEPCVISYTAAIQAWSTSKAPDSQKTKITLELYDRMKQLDRDPDRYLSFDTAAFRAVLNVLAGSSRKDASDISLQILDEMREPKSIEKSIKPDCGCFSACIIAMARHHKPEKAHDLLATAVKQYRDGELDRLPSRGVFVEIIQSYARRTNARTCRQALQVVDIMESLADEVDSDRALADVSVYTMLVDMLVKSGHKGAPEQAQQLLIMMENKRKSGSWRTGTDKFAWNSVIYSWARSMHSDKAEHARGLLEQMIEISSEGGIGSTSVVAPDTVSYNTVLNACAFTKAKNSSRRHEVLQIALDTFQDLKDSSSATPDHLSYGTMMKVYKHFMEPELESTRKILSVFNEACQGGQVGKLVIKELQMVKQQHLEDDIASQLKGYNSLRHRESLPAPWTCHLRER